LLKHSKSISKAAALDEETIQAACEAFNRTQAMEDALQPEAMSNEELIQLEELGHATMPRNYRARTSNDNDDAC